VLKNELLATASQIEEWIENMYDLAKRIDRYQAEHQILERDRKKAETRKSQLEQQLRQEDNPAVKQQIQTTLESLQRQLDTLNSLDDTIQRAYLQLENSLTNLGTIYSQTMLVEAKDIDSSRARRLRHEIGEEVNQLHDILVTMDDIQTAENSAQSSVQ
jgi:chromosome segregation ATPase